MTPKQEAALRLAREALKKCDSALAEELAAWDIDPPLHHVLEASNACGPALAAIDEALAEQPAQPDCPECGNNRQVWDNQITGKKTCHRAGCHLEIEQPVNVAAVNTSSERVDKTAKNVHEQPAQQEPVAYIRSDQLQKAAQSPMLCEVTPEPRQDRIGIFTSPPASKPCEWQREDDIHMPDTWRSDCGVMWTFTDGGPVENDMKHCCGCGAKLREKNA